MTAAALPTYQAFGLCIASEIPLPELQRGAVGATVDIVIRRGEVPIIPTNLDSGACGYEGDAKRACYRYRGAGTFLIEAGERVTVAAEPGVGDDVLRLSLLGPVLGLALEQRSTPTLHGSTVAVEGQAVCFIGAQGTGKSTLAALLQQRGHELVSDDLTVVTLGEDEATVVPGFPQIKLWPDSAQVLGDDAEALPKLHPEFEKRARRFDQGFARQSVPLGLIYVLDFGSALEAEFLEPQEAFLELMRHWYPARFGPSFFESLDRDRQLAQLSQLLQRVPLARLRRPEVGFHEQGHAARLESLIRADLSAVAAPQE